MINSVAPIVARKSNISKSDDASMLDIAAPPTLIHSPKISSLCESNEGNVSLITFNEGNVSLILFINEGNVSLITFINEGYGHDITSICAAYTANTKHLSVAVSDSAGSCKL